MAAASALLVLATLGFLVYEALAVSPTPPDLRVTVAAVQPAGDSYLVEFEATNGGGRTAARVEVEGTMRRGGVTVETASATLDYVPEGGTRRGGLYFTQDPRGQTLELRALGYARP